MAATKRTKAKAKKKTRRKAAKKRTNRKKKAATDGSSAMDFIVAALKKNKKAAYADIKAAADKKGLTIYPIMFGRAQLLLGIAKPRKKKAGKRGPGRRRKANKLPLQDPRAR